MKFNNENAEEQMAYVAPKLKVFKVQPQSMICGSGGIDDIDAQNVEDDGDNWR